MIDNKVFAELQNRGIITNVGLDAKDFNDINDLKMCGFATSIASDTVYAEAVEKFVNTSEILEKFLSDVALGGVVTVPMNLTFTKPIIIEKDVTIDLNGYTLTNTPWDEDGESNAYMFCVKNGKLTLTGDGAVIVPDAVYSMAVWANGGDVEINGGTYKNGGDSCDLVYASKKGHVVINSGEFIAAGPASGNAPGTKNPYSALNIKDSNRSTCSILVKGGKFYMFDPANNLSEGKDTNFVAEGFESIKEGDYYIVSAIPSVVE